MRSLRPPPGARPLLSHGLNAGLRFFSYIDTLTPKNLLGGQTSSATGTPVATTGPAGGCVSFTRASNQRIGFTTPASVASGSVACIVCAKVTAPTGSTAHQLAGTWRPSAGTDGWLFYTSDFAPELGVSFIVGDGAAASAGHLSGDTTAFDGNWHILGGQYDVRTGRIRIFQDGARKNGEGSPVPNYNVASTLGIEIGGNSDAASLASTSSIAWVAIFDRPLSDGEHRAWASGEWTHFTDAVSGPKDTSLRIGSSVTVGSSFTPSLGGVIRVSDGGEIAAGFGGSITPASAAGTFAVATDIRVNQAVPSFATPALFGITSQIVVRESLSLPNQIFISDGGIVVSGGASNGVVPRTGVLASGRYRR